MKVVPVVSNEENFTEADQVRDKRSIHNRRETLSETVTLPLLEKAEKFRNESCIRMSNNGTYKPYPICATDLKTLGKYSIGLQLYFLLIKQLTILFCLISIISIWPMYENYNGGGLVGVFQGQLYLYISVANQPSFDYETDLAKGKEIVHTLHRNVLKLSAADGVYSLLFLVFLIQFSYLSERIEKYNLLEIVTASDYAIEVKGLPKKNIKSEKIREHFSMYGEIAEVSLARNYNGRLKVYKERAEISYKLGFKKLIAKNGKDKHRVSIDFLESEKLNFDKAVRLDDINAGKFNDELPVNRAFVVFERLEDKFRCLNDYNINKCCWRFRKQEIRLMFKGKYKLKTKAACEPSDIIWENLEIGHCQRVGKRIIGLLLTIAIMIISITIVYSIKVYSFHIPNTDFCKKLAVDSNISTTQAASIYTEEDQHTCYCKQQNLYKLVNESNVVDFCRDYIYDQTMLTLLRFIAGAGVIMINFILKMMLSKLSEFEATTTTTKQKVKTMTRVFVAIFINTSIIILLANADLQNSKLVSVLPFNDYFLNGNFSDFNREWYTEVGTVIVSTMIVSAISPQFINLLFWYPLACIKRKCCWKCYKTQITLNSMFAGPEFNVSTRASMTLTIVFSCFLFSGGMPILNFICFLTLFSLYWIDKTLILRHYQRPPHISTNINKRSIALLPFAVIFHCGISFYMYGATNVFPEQLQEIQSEYVQPETMSIKDRGSTFSGLIQLAMAFIFLVYVVFKVLSAICCKQRRDYSDENVAIIQDTYSNHLEKIKAQGIHSYNILENNQYKPLVISLNSAAKQVLRLRKKSLQKNQIRENSEEDVKIHNDVKVEISNI